MDRAAGYLPTMHIVYSKLRDIPINAPSRAKHQWSELRNAYLDIPQNGPVSAQMEKDLIKSSLPNPRRKSLAIFKRPIDLIFSYENNFNNRCVKILGLT